MAVACYLVLASLVVKAKGSLLFQYRLHLRQALHVWVLVLSFLSDTFSSLHGSETLSIYLVSLPWERVSFQSPSGRRSLMLLVVDRESRTSPRGSSFGFGLILFCLFCFDISSACSGSVPLSSGGRVFCFSFRGLRLCFLKKKYNEASDFSHGSYHFPFSSLKHEGRHSPTSCFFHKCSCEQEMEVHGKGSARVYKLPSCL